MTKKEARQRYKQKRTEIPDNQVEKLQDLLLVNFQQLSLPFFEYLHSYLPINTIAEVDTYPIMEYLRFCNPGLQVIVPKTDFSNLSMIHFLYDDNTILKENEYHIMEPVAGNIVEPELIDVVLVPLLAFDEKGNRVGYGKGFYDRFLAECRPDVIKIGLSFFDAVDEISDTNEFDLPLTYCVTPQKLYEF